ncbi:MAG: Holliday junction branch migration protein RuvA, partial [Candidatus Sulfotelmatobacter sp.]
RMVLELRDKLPAAGTSAPTMPALNATEEDVLSALVNLGYQRVAAEKALASAVKSSLGKSDKAGSFDALFREALTGLSK